ncbi:MAG: hypothetical protein HN759_10885 [Akkermansiaceae bacterium]|nr:hypothetical protein [Akkermansiaceae bacterium]
MTKPSPGHDRPPNIIGGHDTPFVPRAFRLRHRVDCPFLAAQRQTGGRAREFIELSPHPESQACHLPLHGRWAVTH